MVIFHSYVNVYQRVPEKMMEHVGLMENEGLDQTNRGNDRNSPTHTGVNQPKNTKHIVSDSF